MAFQALYSWDASCSQAGSKSVPEDLLGFGWALRSDEAKELDEETAAFSRLLITGTVENIAAIDIIIQKHLKNWDIKRLNRVDHAVLRMSTYCLLFQDSMPPSVVIDEAVDIAKEFGTDDSFRFVNGVLDGIRKSNAGIDN